MNNKRVGSNMLLLLTAAIWGFAFVAQRVGSQYVGAFTFNGIRFAIGGISLIPLIIYFDKRKKGDSSNESKVQVNTKKLILQGVVGWYCPLRSCNATANWSYLYNSWKGELYYRALYGFCADYRNIIEA